MRFGNQRSFEVVDDGMKGRIRESIEEMGGYSMEGKYSHVLNKTHLQTVRENTDSYRVTVGTFGKKYLIYLTKMDGKNFVFFINRKSGQIIKTKFTFMASLFEGTMAEGELVRYNAENGGEDGNDWIFLINDLIYYEGKDLIAEKWEKRNEALQEMIEKKYRHDAGSPFKLVVKRYIGVDYAKSMVNDLIPRLKYKCNGLIFRHVTEFDRAFAYIIPDGEAKEGSAGVARVVKSSGSGDRSSSSNDFLDQLALGCEVVAFEGDEKESTLGKKQEERSEVRRVGGKKLYTEMDDEEEAEHHQAIPESSSDTDSESEDEEEVFETFVVKKTEYPDVYELYKIKSGGALEKHSYAAVSAMVTSKMMKGVFAERDEAQMKCRYNSGFKRWVPIECV
jgi:mRNA capping enzyme, catalytic domain